MNYIEAGFRKLYKKFIVFMLNDRLVHSLDGYPGVDEANCIITYGYIDHQTGFRAEILAAGYKSEEGYRFFDGSNTHRSFLQIGAVKEDEFFIIDDKNDSLKTRYSDKLELVNDYYVSDDVEKTRYMEFLDRSRHELYPDDITVFLTKGELEPEGCWVRLTDLGENYIIGTLLNEPYRDFGCHEGDRIAVYIQKMDSGDSVCISDSKPLAVSIDDDHKRFVNEIKALISNFKKENDKEKLAELLRMIHYSYVWIPCRVASDEKDNSIKTSGGSFLNSDNIKMIPQLLTGGKDGEQTFFPAFLSAEEMGDDSKDFAKVEKRFVDVVSLAKDIEGGVVGIMLNPFTDPFLIPAGLFDMFDEYVQKEEI